MYVFRMTLIWCAMSSSLLAQTPVATLVGRVVDATGAGIPQAAIRARHIETNATRAAHTDATGDYALPEPYARDL